MISPKHVALSLLLLTGTQSVSSTASDHSVQTLAASPARTKPAPTSPAQTNPAPRKVPVFWLLGQSNAGGATAGFWLANPLVKENKWPHLAKQDRVRIWWPGKSKFRPKSVAAWEGYNTGSIKGDNNASLQINENMFGPEAGIAGAAREHLSADIYIFKYTGVASLGTHPKLPTWSKKPGSVFEKAIAEWKLASAALLKAGFLPDVKAVFWIQAEADYKNALIYDVLLKTFIADLRKAITKTVPRKYRRKLRRTYPLPFVISQMHNNHLPRTGWPRVETLIRTAQAKISRTGRYVYLCATEDLLVPQITPAVHYDPASTVRHGFILYDTLKRGLGKKLR